MRTADRLLAQGLGTPFRLDVAEREYPGFKQIWRAEQTQIATDLRAGPVLVADNVADYVRRTGSLTLVLSDFPCLAPPWPVFWVEYSSLSGNERRGVLIKDVTDQIGRSDPRGSFQGAIDDAREDNPDVEIRWLLDCAVVAEAEKRVAGPLGWIVLALNPLGRCVGNRWSVASPKGAQVVDHLFMPDGKRVNLDQWLHSVLLPGLQTIAFLHCKNITLDTVRPPEKLSRRYIKRHGHPLMEYRTVRLEVPRRTSTSKGVSEGGKPNPSPLRIWAGHFVHYGNCCPGGHNPHGRLFGRLEGIYWVPQHARGNPELGIVRRDYDVIIKKPVS